MLESMLTTVDNPHDPFESFAPWYAWDEGMGYHTSSFLARIVMPSDALSETQQNSEHTSAIDEIIKENSSGLYRKVTREVPDP
jgi:hypothetical protein